MFRDALLVSAPPDVDVTQDFINNMLAGCMQGNVQCWLSYSDADGSVYGVVLTRLDRKPYAGVNNLVIISLRGFGGEPGSMWLKGMMTLKRFAQGQGCKRITAYVANERAVRMTELLGANCDMRVMSWEI